MGWLNKFCRNAGLMVHNIVDPYGEKSASSRRKIVSKKVEEKKVSPSVTLRKTTIEEVEVKPGNGAKGNIAGDQEDTNENNH